MRIEYERYSVLMSTVNEMLEGKHMNIYEHTRTKEDGSRRVQFGINWAGIGTVEPDKAEEFANNLKDAAAVAELLNRCDIAYYFNEDEDPADEEALAAKIANAVKHLSRIDLIEALEG